MTEAIVFPDAEALLVTALSPLVGVPVATRVPNPRPASFVRVKRVGGTIRDVVTDEPLVVVECWAETEIAASDLGRVVRARVFALAQTSVGVDFVRAVREVGGLQAFPDPVSESPRYQFTVQIQTKGVPL
jgi:hypothetical protein